MSTIWDKLGSALTKLLSKQDQGKPLNTLLNPQKTPLATNPLPPKTTISGIVSGGVGIGIPATETAGGNGKWTSKSSVTGNPGSSGINAVPDSKPYAGKMPASQIVGSASGSVGNRSGSPKSILPSGTSSGNHDNASASPNDRPGSRPDSSLAGTAIPKEHAGLASLLEKAASDIDFNNWADKTYKQQLVAAQKSGLSEKDQWALLNAAPHYVETIAKVQDIFAYRTELGLTIGDAKILAKKLFAIADERNDAINRVGRFENDPNVVPKVLRLLDEQEDKLLGGLGKDTNETGQTTWYNGEETETSADIHRRAKYADIDDAVATKQIEKLIETNMIKAMGVDFLSERTGNVLTENLNRLLWFYLKTKQNAAMDYKNPAIWQKALPGLPYPEEDQVYHAFGYDISSSDLGNLNYALVGKALGIPETLLLQQAGAAALRDHFNVDFFASQYDSLEKRDTGYGDESDDQEMITNGFDVYHTLY